MVSYNSKKTTLSQALVVSIGVPLALVNRNLAFGGAGDDLFEFLPRRGTCQYKMGGGNIFDRWTGQERTHQVVKNTLVERSLVSSALP